MNQIYLIQLWRKDHGMKKNPKQTKAAGNWCKQLSSLFTLLESCFKMSQRHPETFTQATTHAELILGAYN